MKYDKQQISRTGFAIAAGIILLWVANLLFWISRDLSALPLALVPLGIVLQIFLYTGLFITAHDAMHGCVTPANHGLNNAIGTLCVALYALFSFNKLHEKHWEHHRHPASGDDPDFHDGEHPQFLRWYGHFLWSYISWWQVAGMALIFNVLEHVAGVPALNLVLFWVIPSLLSTFQLFYFGTFLPHREEEAGFSDEHRARSNSFSPLLSLLTCYHFGGYHWEHHAYPHVPWWKLPATRKNAVTTHRVTE